MSKKSKPFVIATEGPTVDGRHISREMLTQMAANYKPEIYTAVVNLEHILSLHPQSDFSAYGKVIALSTREADILGQKRLQLTAVVEANDAAVSMQKEGKKCFASMETLANFTGRGEAYLTGLALTDTPASVGTEAMRFSAFSDGKADKVFSSPSETELAFEAIENLAGPEGSALFDKVKALLGFAGKTNGDRFADHGRAIEALAEAQKEGAELVAELARQFAEREKKLAADFAGLKTTLDEAFKTLAETPSAHSQRPAAPGGAGTLKTDC